MSEIVEQLKQVIGFIRSGASNESVNAATEWLLQFYQEPTSVSTIINIYTDFSEAIYRQFLVIALKQCVSNSWDLFDDQSKSDIIASLLTMYKSESDYNNRQNILHIIQLKMDAVYYPVFIPFIQSLAESGENSDLELILCLCPLVDVSQMEQENAEETTNFLLTMLDRGFNSEDILTRYSALFYLYLPSCNTDLILDKIPEYWASALQIFQPFYEQQTLFKRVANTFNFAINCQKFSVDILPLLELCLTLVHKPENDSYLLLEFATLIESMCQQYTSVVVESGYVNNIFEVFMLISIKLFEPDDPLSITQANFFEKTFQVLCQYQELLEYLYSLFQQLESNTANHFIIVRSLASMFYCSREFFLDKLGDIADVLAGGMQSDSLLLVEGSVSAVDTFIENFYIDIGDLEEPLVSEVLAAAKNALTVDVVTAFANILDKINQSDFIFDTAFEFLVEIISNSEPVLQQAALSCMNMLVRSSTMKISTHLETFMQLMIEIINSMSDTADILKPICVECIHSAANNVGSEFDNYASIFLNYIVENLSNESQGLALTCFQALELMAIKKPDLFMEVVDQIMSKVLALAATDPSKEYERAMLFAATEDDITAVESQYTALFKQTEIALRLIAILSNMSPDLTKMFLTHTLQCATIQSQSRNSDCKCASAFAVSCIADALADPMTKPPETITTQMGNIILAVIPDADDCPESKEASDGFSTAAHMIDVLEYQTFGSLTRNLIVNALNYINAFISSDDRQLVSKCGQTLYSMQLFLSMVAASAGEMAFTVLQDFMPICNNLLTSNEPSLKSFALSFFASIVSSCSESLDEGFKQELLKTSMGIAEECEEADAFVLIHQIGRAEPQLIENVSDDLYKLCIEKLTMEGSNADRYYRMRDNCLIAFGMLVMNICPDKYDIEEFMLPSLSAMPLVKDFEYITEQIDYFIWLYSKADISYKESFFQILVVVFALPKHVFDNMKIPPMYIEKLLAVLRELMELYPNRDELISTYLEGDEEKIAFFNAAMNSQE